MESPDEFQFLRRFRTRLYILVFETNTRSGRIFDIVLLWTILLSIIAVVLESVDEINSKYGTFFSIAEWTFTLIFTFEYLTRLFISRRPLSYALSFYGIVDLLATIPTYLALFFAGGGYLVVIRALRLLRVFRILKLSRQLGEAQMLGKALVASRHKISVFLGAVLATVIIMGTMMYMIEGGENGFTSIPRSIYWAIVTITTVGYGDIAPTTVIGQLFASMLMLMGYAIIAVPTGIVTAEIAVTHVDQQVKKRDENYKSCEECLTHDHELKAKFCKYCGAVMKKSRRKNVSRDYDIL